MQRIITSLRDGQMKRTQRASRDLREFYSVTVTNDDWIPFALKRR
jgi:hypothetical protein